MSCCDEPARSCEDTGASVCSSSSSEHEGSKLAYREDASPHYSRRSLPSYAVWRARQLASRDLLFGTFLMLITLIYLYRTAPKLCDEAVYARLLGVRCSRIQRDYECLEVCQQPEQPPGLVWRLVCQYSANPTRATASHEASVMQNSICSAIDECSVSSATEATAAAAARVTKESTVRLAFHEVIRCSRSVVLKVFRAVVMFFIAGALSGDPFHITMPLLRLSLLLLLLVPMPYPNIAAVWHAATAGVGRQHAGSSWIRWYYPRHYWQSSNFRLVVVVVQRVVTALAAFACVGFRYSAYFESSMRIMYWQGVAKYVFQGWLAWMLVLPFRLHLVVSAVEWVFFYALGVQIERLYHGQAGFFHLYHLVTSLMAVTILPSVGVWWLERSQQARYQELARLTGSPTAGSTASSSARPLADGEAVAASPRPEKLDISNSSSASHPASKSHCRRRRSQLSSLSSQTSAASQQLYSSVVDGLQLLEAQKQQQQQQQQVAVTESGDAAEAQAAANTFAETAESRAWPAVPSILSSVGPALRSVLADEAAEIFAAAAACAAVAGGAAVGAVPSYTSMAKCLPASVKVHTSHSQVSLLEPLLTSCLASQASQLTSSPAYMQTACFAGCVQLLANMFVARSSASGAGDSTAGDGGQRGSAFAAAASNRGMVSGAGGGAAPALLAAVRAALRAGQAAVGHSKQQDSSGSSATAAATEAAASVQPMVLFKTDSAHVDVDVDVDVDVVFADTVASTRRKGAGAVSSDVAGVQLLSCEPACLTSGVSQQLTLHLQLPGAAAGVDASDDCRAARLVVFIDGVVLLDEQVTVKEQLSATLLAPEAPGVVNIALLPCANTASAGAATDPVDKIGEQQPIAADQDSPGPAVPFLLTPLLVLPGEAAHEVQRYWQQTASAAVTDSSSSSSSDGSSSAWQAGVLPMTVDIAYILAASSSAAMESANKTSARGVRGTEEVRTVLKHLLLHLARCGMFHTMHLVVTAAAAAAAALQQGPAAENNADNDGSSSSSDGSVVECGPAAAPEASDSSIAAPSAAEIEPAAHDDDNGGSCESGKTCSNTSSTLRQDASLAAGGNISVAASELLWGFKNPAIESSYQAATFSATNMLDCACTVYNLVLSLCCYPSRGQKHQGSFGMLRLPDKPSGAVLMFSRLLALAVVAAGPVGVLLVRLRVAGQLQALAQQRQQQQRHQQQQQRQQADSEGEGGKSGTPQMAYCSSGSSSSSSKATRMDAAVISSQQQQHLYNDQVSAVLASAAVMKQWLQLYWMVAINVWGVLVLLGVGAAFIAPPVPILRVWASSRWAADVGITTSVALRGWVSQVPLAWHLPLIFTELAVNSVGSWMVGVHPAYWPFVRFLMGVIVPVVVATWQHWQGRRRFCVTRGIQVA